MSAEATSNEVYSEFCKEIFSEFNRARTKPVEYGRDLSSLRSCFDGVDLRLPSGRVIRTEEGPSALTVTLKTCMFLSSF